MITTIGEPAHPLVPAFLAYCAAHGREHDESFVPGATWAFGADFPSFTLTDDAGEVRGVAAFMFGPSYRAARRARVAVLHVADTGDVAGYRALVDAAFEALRGHADSCYLFFPEILPVLRSILEGLGFRFERTAYLMRADIGSDANLKVAMDSLPPGYRLKSVGPDDERAIADFVAVRNRNFRELKGSVDTRPEDLLAFMASGEYLPGGLLLVLSPEGAPCGTLRVEREHDDEPDSGFIGTISVDRERRGQGLGRALVRTALGISRQNGFRQAFLSVNADNEGPLALYRSEGFSLVKAMTCMEARI